MGELFQTSRPGPKRQPKKDAARERVIELRRQRHGIEEIVAELARAGTPLSRTAVWEILHEEGLSRMPTPPQPTPAAPAPARLAAEKVRVLREADWPTEGTLQTQHAGLFLLIGELVALDLPGLVKAAGWPQIRHASFRPSARCCRCWRSSSQDAGGEATCARSCTTPRSGSSRV